MRLLPLLVLAGLLAAPAATAAGGGEFAGHHTQVETVVVVRGLTLADLPKLAQRGAVGLMVPSAGPRTSAALAFAGVVRGVLHNARLGAKPDAPVLIRVEHSDAIPITANEIVLGLPASHVTANDRRYPIAVLGACRGVLVSSLTRVPGLVSAADVARTALASPHALRCHRDANAAGTLKRLEHRIEVARASTLVALVLVLSLAIAFALLLPEGTLPALAAALLANLALGLVPGGSVVTRLASFTLAGLAGGLLGRPLVRRPVSLGLALAGVLAAYVLAMVVRPSALSLAPLGPELTARFFGVSNVLETLLLVPTLAGAALLARRFGPVAFVGAAALGFATIAENRLGADGGGAVVLGTAFAVLAVWMTRARLRMLVPALVTAALAVFGLLDLDAATSSPDHLRGALDGGVSGLATVVAHRVPLAYSRVAEQWYLVFPLAALALLVLRSWRRPAPRDRRAVVVALAAGVLASLLVNDSPGPVAIAALAAFLALEPYAVRHELGLAATRLLQPPSAPAAALARAEQR